VRQHTGTFLGQIDVDGKTSELTRFRPLLAPLDLAGVIITADALHTQRERAHWLADEKKAG
jgi:predicted transposase YbfD/YdcC